MKSHVKPSGTTSTFLCRIHPQAGVLGFLNQMAVLLALDRPDWRRSFARRGHCEEHSQALMHQNATHGRIPVSPTVTQQDIVSHTLLLIPLFPSGQRVAAFVPMGPFEKGDLVVLRRSSGMSTPSHLPTSQLPQRIKPQPSPPPSTTAGHTLRLSLCGARIHGDMGGKLHLEGG